MKFIISDIHVGDIITVSGHYELIQPNSDWLISGLYICYKYLWVIDKLSGNRWVWVWARVLGSIRIWILGK